MLRTDILELKDLKPGMELTGTVRNVIDFGAFVDIGVHQDGWYTSLKSAINISSTPARCLRSGTSSRSGFSMQTRLKNGLA